MANNGTSEVRQNALKELKFKRTAAKQAASASREDSPAMLSANGYVAPPAQSRDATQATRYTTPTRPPQVLVPNTSPVSISSPSSAVVFPPNGVPPRPPPIGLGADPGFWQYRPPGTKQPKRDILTTSSFFIGASNVGSGAGKSSASNGKATDTAPDVSHQVSSAISSPSSSSVILVPESPGVGRPAKRRKVSAPASDVESSPEAGNSRIIRGVRPELPVAKFTSSDFVMWRMGYPGEDNRRAEAAWALAKGVPSEASKLMSQPSFTSPSPLPQPLLSQPTPLPPSTPLVGSQSSDISEEVELKKAQRAATKAKQEQSSIYRRSQATLPTKSAIPSQAITIISSPPIPHRPITIFSSPPGPVVPPKPTLARKAKRVVHDSDSDSAYDSAGDESSDPDAEEQVQAFHRFEAVKWFNDSDAATLMELTGCDRPQADAIIAKRPYSNADDLIEKLGQGRRKAGPKGLSPNMFDDVVTILTGYSTVDDILKKCEDFGENIRRILESWTPGGSEEHDDGGLALGDLSKVQVKGFIREQPESLSSSVVLKDYQLLGLNWLNLMYDKKRSCILADEMGLGKTVQVIAFIAHLRDRGVRGPHLIVVPSSTLENWMREFQRFAPSVPVRAYYAGKAERAQMRDELKANCLGHGAEAWDVLITTYTLAQGDENDRRFFRKMPWVACIFDEGHVLKNFLSQRYNSLTGIPSSWRLLLTGTPLQNNFQELVSLMNFILPNMFETAIDELRAIFKVKADSAASLLSRERISRAKKMMTPFVLRRRKDQVLKDLPKKRERVEYCKLNALQSEIYRGAMLRSRKLVLESAPETPDTLSSNEDSGPETKRKKSKPLLKAKLYKDTSSNVLMDLRKASSHPMLFRRRFTDKELDAMTKILLKQPDFVKRGALYEVIKEDMEVMTDSELQRFCKENKCLKKYIQDSSCYLDSGKIEVLLSLLESYQKEGRRVLVFSQFTQILDILEVVLQQKSLQYLVLTGSTPVDLRQSLVDEFNEDEDIKVFLLSTRAGGMGINLTAASVVILFDQDFNPHNDKQAADRAYRIGQTRDVDVVKLITKGTIEEDMLRLAQTKLALDEAVAGEDGDSRAEKVMRQSLMSQLREQFQAEEPGKS